jgi:hypothetical protein
MPACVVWCSTSPNDILICKPAGHFLSVSLPQPAIFWAKSATCHDRGGLLEALEGLRSTC